MPYIYIYICYFHIFSFISTHTENNLCSKDNRKVEIKFDITERVSSSSETHTVLIWPDEKRQMWIDLCLRRFCFEQLKPTPINCSKAFNTFFVRLVYIRSMSFNWETLAVSWHAEHVFNMHSRSSSSIFLCQSFSLTHLFYSHTHFFS